MRPLPHQTVATQGEKNEQNEPEKHPEKASGTQGNAQGERNEPRAPCHTALLSRKARRTREAS